MHAIVLFDGQCHFCDASVQFIMKRDRAGYFRFASLQSEAGQALLAQYAIPSTTDSLVVIEQGRAYVQSAAVLRIVRKLNGAWSLFYGARIVPAILRDPLYKLFAKNRYRFFGKKDVCTLPTAEQRQRFL